MYRHPVDNNKLGRRQASTKMKRNLKILSAWMMNRLIGQWKTRKMSSFSTSSCSSTHHEKCHCHCKCCVGVCTQHYLLLKFVETRARNERSNNNNNSKKWFGSARQPNGVRHTTWNRERRIMLYRRKRETENRNDLSLHCISQNFFFFHPLFNVMRRRQLEDKVLSLMCDPSSLLLHRPPPIALPLSLSLSVASPHLPAQ